MENRELSCEDRIEDSLNRTLETLKELWEGYCSGEEGKDEEFFNYGLCFDYVAPDTFSDQEEGYFRYQLSYGGPSTEFRFYVNPDFRCHRVEYVYLDWFDGATRRLYDENKAFMLDIWEFFREISAEHVYLEATK
jgi:hypothetical protein